MQYLKSLFFPTADDVLASFTRTVDKLGKIAERQKTRSHQLNAAAIRLEIEAANAFDESVKADSIRDKIKNLISA